MKQAVVYIRVSTKERLRGGSLATQLGTCLAYAKFY